MLSDPAKTCTNFNKRTNIFLSKNNRLAPLKDISLLTMYDYERIKKNAYMAGDQNEELARQQIIKEQKYQSEAKMRNLKERLHTYDKNRNNKYLSEIDKEDEENKKTIIAEARRKLDKNEDAIKEMDKLVLYAKIATIREKQLNEHKVANEHYKRKEQKLDLLMELDRLKSLKLQQEREEIRKKQQREGALVIKDQIKERELERLREKEIIEKDRVLMNKKIQDMLEEDRKDAEKKKLFYAQTAKEIENANKISALSKEKKKKEEKDLDLKILKYNMDKAKKEEEDIANKKKIREEKEKELQKLREKQEKAQDKQSELDALRAKRAYEDNEKQVRIKERDEIIIKKKKIEDLLVANERQKIDKELKLAEMAKQEQEEYEQVIKRQIEELENEKRIEQERKKLRYLHNQDLLTMIKLREEKEKIEAREILEEGRKVKQNLDVYKEKMEKYKQEKINELKALNIHPKFIVDLEKYKI